MTKSTTTSTVKTNKAAAPRARAHNAPPVAGTPAHELENAKEPSTTANIKAKAQQASDKLSKKADDVKARASHAADQASESFDHARASVEESYHAGSARARETYETTTRRAGEFAREHPFAVGAMGLVAGFALGALLPRTSREDRVFGERRDGLLHKAAKSGEEVLKQGRAKAESTVRNLRGDNDGMTDEERLEEGLEDTFPASDPVSATRSTGAEVLRD
ncbi:DUF883 family protein [Roseibium limicola]|uniref:DUF883 domain-containing protein n=1 Tax=Roseibium limicola TaxID=2816037 RepID=A0A939ETG3_9HYPH|nr:hypothetical protein [Roseibium limicola]MBO0347343.1 hypothetical protein [Roseibium limicola]